MAVDEGYRLVDTASMYRNEEGVGEALLGRTDVFVTTKLGNSDHGFDEAMRAFDASIKKLRRDTLDLLFDPLAAPARQPLCRELEGARSSAEGRAGFARSASRISIADHLERIIGETGVTPPVNQIELHPRFQQKALRAFHDQKGIKTESWSPLGRGGLLSESALVEIAAKHQKTPAQVVIRWHLDSGLIVIPKTVRLERLKREHRRARFQARWRRHEANRRRWIRPAAEWAPIRPRRLSDGSRRRADAGAAPTSGGLPVARAPSPRVAPQRPDQKILI